MCDREAQNHNLVHGASMSDVSELDDKLVASNKSTSAIEKNNIFEIIYFLQIYFQCILQS
jgi:hypothetical protein